MQPKEILDKFAEYIGFDPDEKRFNILSAQYQFHLAGEKIQKLLTSGYDKTGILSVMYAKHVFEDVAKQCSVSIFDYLTNPEAIADLNRDREMYHLLNSEEVCQEELQYIADMDKLICQVVGKSLIGNPNLEEEKKTFFDNMFKVLNTIDRCHVDLFKSGGSIGEIRKFNTKIFVFERMADCLLYLEKSEDAIYFCYINQYQSADGYFAFMIKSNGTILSVNDRVNEEYIGQHKCISRRNSSWTEAHNNYIFPYDYIFQYSGHDSKGYATKYFIDPDKLNFMQMEPDVYQPVLIAMILLVSSYQGYTPQEDPLYLNTMLQENFLEEHKKTTELAVYNKSAIVAYHHDLNIELDNEKVLSGEYIKQFGDKAMEGHSIGQFWVDLYGDGFVYQPENFLSSMDKTLSGEAGQFVLPEFIGSKEHMSLEVYRKIRVRLADYIQKKMMAEYDAFGGADAAKQWWARKASEHKKDIEELACCFRYIQEHPELKKTKNKEELLSIAELINKEATDVTDILDRAEKCPNASFYAICLNQNFKGRNYCPEYLDDETGSKCKVFFRIRFDNWKQMEDFLGEELPKIFLGWSHRGEIGYSGNPLLNVTDKCALIKSPLCGGDRPDGVRGGYQKVSFDIELGFSMKHWNKMYKEYLVKNGLEENKSHADSAKSSQFPAIYIYKKNSYIEGYENSAELEELSRKLFEIDPELRLGAFTLSGSEGLKRVVSVKLDFKEKGRKETVRSLENLGFKKWRRYRAFDGNDEYGRSTYAFRIVMSKGLRG